MCTLFVQLMKELMKPQPDWGPLKRTNRTGIYDIDLTAPTYEFVDWAGRLYLPQTIMLARTPAGSTMNVTNVSNYSGPVPVILNVKDKFLLSPSSPRGLSRQLSQSTSDIESNSSPVGAAASTRKRITSGSVPNLQDVGHKNDATSAAPATSTAGKLGASFSNLAGNLKNFGRKKRTNESRSGSNSRTASQKNIHDVAGSSSKKDSNESVV